jgi:hypothetical protein
VYQFGRQLQIKHNTGISPDMAVIKSLAERGGRQWLRLACWSLVTAAFLTCGGAAHATLTLSLDSISGCSGTKCGSDPWGPVKDTQDASSSKAIDFTLSLNSPFEFWSSASASSPVFAIDTGVSGVTFGNFKNNGTTTITLASAGAHTVNGYGTLPYALTAASSFSGPLTFTESVATGAPAPTKIVSNGTGYMTAAIVTILHTIKNGIVAAIHAPVPEPAALGVLAVALAGVGVVRSLRGRQRR